jgi:hypothetical protein
MTATAQRQTLLGVVAVLVIVPAVGSASAGETRMETNVRPAVELTAKLEVSKEMLTIEYDVHNRSDKVIYVFDRLTSFEGPATKVEPDQAFVLLEGADAVRIVCALMPKPDLMSIARRPPTYVSIVQPQGSRTGRLNLGLPLIERHPFYPKINKEAGKETLVQRLILELGWVEQRPGMKLSERQSALGTEVELSGGWGKPVQWISEMALAAPGLPVVRHPNPFERSRPLK